MATNLKATPRDSSPGSQRNYLRTSLDQFGPNTGEPYAAPALDVKDASGKRVTLEEYKGKNVILVFYLGAECPHCLRQLHDIGDKKDAPTANAAALESFGDLPVRLLSDNAFANAHPDRPQRPRILGAHRWRPFSDTGYLVKQVERINAAAK